MFDGFFFNDLILSIFGSASTGKIVCGQLGVQEFLAGLNRPLTLMSDCYLVSTYVLYFVFVICHFMEGDFNHIQCLQVFCFECWF